MPQKLIPLLGLDLCLGSHLLPYMLECPGCGPARRKATSPTGDIYERLYQDAEERKQERKKTALPPSVLCTTLTQSQLFVTSLVQRQKIAAERVISLRKQRLDEELKELKPAPTINRRSHELAKDRSQRKLKPVVRRSTMYRYDGPKEVEIRLPIDDIEERISPPALPSREDSSVYLSDLLSPQSIAEVSSRPKVSKET